MNRIVGIDLGTTNSLVAVVESGIPLVLADADGQRLTPSVVHFPEGRGAPLVGRAAARLRLVQPARTVYSAKRFMGRRGSEVLAEEIGVTYPIRAERSQPVAFPLGDQVYLPEEVAAQVLKKLRSDAETALGEPVERAVITVPAYFNDAQRAATKRAGELAGFRVERIINEPTAAALAYGLDRLKEHSRIAVYDLGGGTFDLSILELRHGVFQVLATNGNTRLGGDDLDRRLAAFLADEIAAQGGPDLRPAMSRGPRETSEGPRPAPVPSSPAGRPANPEVRVQLARLREAAEDAKIRLSSVAEVEVTLPFLTPEFSFARRLTRLELEGLTREVVLQTRAHCLRALADAKTEPRQVDQVILVGGQTRMPLVRRLVAEWFGCANAAEFGARPNVSDSGPMLNVSQNPDEAVALGAATQAEILAGGLQQVLLLDVTPLSLGIETFGGLMNVIIPRNSTIPLKAGEMFTTAVDGQCSVLIHVLQGERERARDNWSLGRFELEFEPAPKGVPRVGVQFEIDADGLLHVLARDTRTGQEKIVQMRSVVDVDDVEVQRMVEASLDHAAEDLEARRWIQARVRALETLAATRKGLGDAADEVPAEVQERIRTSISEVERVLAAEDPTTKVGNLKALEQASNTLDEATRPLADSLMDRAMLAMLQKRGLVK